MIYKKKYVKDKNCSQKQNKKTQRKIFQLLGDSMLKHLDSWQVNNKIKSIASAKPILGATIKDVPYYLRGCLEEIFPDYVILHYDMNDLKSNNAP